MWHHNVDLLAYHDLDGRSPRRSTLSATVPHASSRPAATNARW